MKNWKTTLAGAVVALGVYLSTVKDPPWLGTVGEVMMGVGGFLTGWLAKDFNVSNSPTPVPAQAVKKTE